MLIINPVNSVNTALKGTVAFKDTTSAYKVNKLFAYMYLFDKVTYITSYNVQKADFQASYATLEYEHSQQEKLQTVLEAMLFLQVNNSYLFS